MSNQSNQAKPANISEERWKQHMDWMQVTGATTQKHLREHQEGHLWRDYERFQAQR